MTIHVTQTSGGGQETPVYQAFQFGIRFYVTDEDGHPLEGVLIDLQSQVAGNGATGYFQTGDPNANYVTVTSGPDGYTNLVGMYANGVEGSWDVAIWLWISYSGPSQFSMTNTAPTGAAVATNVTVEAGNGQTVAPNTALPTAITVVVYDQYGARWPGGVSVTATAPSSGASGVFASTGTNTKTVTTDANGWASLETFTTNGTDGAFYIDLTSSGLSPAKALVTIKTPTAEVCTPPSKMTQAIGQTSWQNAVRWFSGAAQSNNYASLAVDGTNTPAQSVIAYTFDAAQLALIKDLAEITSIQLTHSHKTTRSGSYYPTKFIAYMNLADSGLLTTTRNTGGGLENTWQSFDYTWTTFSNTGNAGNKLYGFEIKGDNLQAIIQFTGETNTNTAGTFQVNGANLVICYINPEGGEEQSLQLCIL